MSDNKKEKQTLLKFPCDFPIKVVSNANFELEASVTQIVHTHIPGMEYIPITRNESKKGNYQSITVTVKASNQQQIDAIYQELSAVEAIIMVL